MKKKILIPLIALIAIILIIIVNNIIKKSKHSKEIDTSDLATLTPQTTFQTKETEIDKNISKKTIKSDERRRMQIYFGQYMRLIDTKQYEKAYSKLNPEFKQANFTDINKFIEYCKKTYPSTSSIEYDTINRNGDMYILTVNITDSFNTNFKTITQRIVVKEISNNNYEISFQLN